MADVYRRSALGLFALANKAYRNAVVTFYKVDATTKARLNTLVDIWDAPVGGSLLSNPYTLSSSGKANNILYFDEPLVAVINDTEIGAHETGVILPDSFTYQGDWEPNKLYLAGQLVNDGAAGLDTDNLYVCATDHTSTTWSADLALLRWQVVANSVDAAVAAQAAAEAAAANALTSQTAAASSASAAATSETNAAASETAAVAAAASLNIENPANGDAGAILVQNAADDGYEKLAQGSTGEVLLSAGADANPAFSNELGTAMLLNNTPREGYNRQIVYRGDVVDSASDEFVTRFVQATRLHKITSDLAAGTVTANLKKNGTAIQFGASTNISVTTTATEVAVNVGGNAYIDFAAGDTLEIARSSASSAEDLTIDLYTTENKQ